MSVEGLLRRLSSSRKDSIRRVLAWVPPSLRQSPVYRHWCRFLRRAQYWPVDQIQQWQLKKLREIIRNAVSQTEGYRELYRKAGIQAEDIRTPADVSHLPFTTKEMFRDNLSVFSARNSGARHVTTGGSTGIPFGFYEMPETQEIEKAFMHTGWSRAGWRLGQVSAVLRGGYVGSEANFSAYDSFHREFALSSYYLSSKAIHAYVEALQSRDIRVLQAYPSSLNLLCDLISESGLRGRLQLDLILLGSENVYDWQLEKFESIFTNARIFAWYGHCEKAVLAPWCEHTRQGHAWPFYGYTEILAPDGATVPEGEEGEIVGTSFIQTTTPFIRYRTMDRAVRGADRCQACGRNFPLLSRISGRSHEVIVTRTGRFISMTAINMHDDIFEGLRQFQFLQETPGEIIFCYVPKDVHLASSDTTRITAGLMAKLGDDVNLTLKAVPQISRTKAGKFRFLDQRLPIRYGDT